MLKTVRGRVGRLWGVMGIAWVLEGVWERNVEMRSFCRVGIGVGYNVQGKRLAVVGISNSPNVFAQPFHSLNFKALSLRTMKLMLTIIGLHRRRVTVVTAMAATMVTAVTFVTPVTLISTRHAANIIMVCFFFATTRTTKYIT